MLNGGANDLGGTLMEETISRMAGSEHGSAKTVDELVAIARASGAPRVNAPPPTRPSPRSTGEFARVVNRRRVEHVYRGQPTPRSAS